MDNKIKNKSMPDLYDVLKENYEINKRTKAKTELYRELLNYGKESISYKNDFAQIESIVGLKKNLEYFFYDLLPYFIQDYLIRKQNEIDTLDASKNRIYFDFDLFYHKNECKYILLDANKTKYILPSDDNNNFEDLLAEFINEYQLHALVSKDYMNQKYQIIITASLKDLVYACYIGQEWVKHLEDECLELLSDYYSEEQLDSFKKTLHR